MRVNSSATFCRSAALHQRKRTCVSHKRLGRGHFEAERVGTLFPLLKSCRNVAFPLLKCIRISTHYGHHCEPFSGREHALDRRILHLQSQNTFSGNNTPTPLQKRPRCLDLDTNFLLARQRSHCSCLRKRPLGWGSRIV